MRKFERVLNQSMLTEPIDLNYRTIHQVFKKRYYVAYKHEKMTAITLCSTFDSDCCYYNSNNHIIRNKYCLSKKFFVKLCLLKRFLNLSTEAVVNVQFAHPRANCTVFPSKIKPLHFLSQTFEEVEKLNEEIVADVFCPDRH